MPYQAAQPIIVSLQDELGRHQGYHEYLPQNGTRLRLHNGLLLNSKYNSRDNYILYVKRAPTGNFSGAIRDKILVQRIKEYLACYYGQKYTNCSAFAHFLFTGEFRECRIENNLAVVHHHMSHYKNVSRVRVGDMFCVIYLRKHIGQSRRTEWRRHFLDVKKRRRSKGPTLRQSLKTTDPVLPPNEILEFCKNPAMVDYHFMICVDNKNGKPVWLSQLGRDEGDGDLAPLAITLGDEDLRPHETPLLCLIKRR